LALKPLGVS